MDSGDALRVVLEDGRVCRFRWPWAKAKRAVWYHMYGYCSTEEALSDKLGIGVGLGWGPTSLVVHILKICDK